MKTPIWLREEYKLDILAARKNGTVTKADTIKKNEEKRRIEVVSKGLKITGDNLHKNFTDLNPKFAAARHERAVKVAKRYLGIVGE